MPTYSFICKSCEATTSKKYHRGQAPKHIQCECGKTQVRVFKINGTCNIATKETPSSEAKLRKNLKGREEKFNKMDNKIKERYKKWSLDLTGGKY